MVNSITGLETLEIVQCQGGRHGILCDNSEHFQILYERLHKLQLAELGILYKSLLTLDPLE